VAKQVADRLVSILRAYLVKVKRWGELS